MSSAKIRDYPAGRSSFDDDAGTGVHIDMRASGLKLLLAGLWQYRFYEEACATALEKLGVQVIPFRWRNYFASLVGRAEAKYAFNGPMTRALNRDLVECAIQHRANLVLVWRGTNILPSTLQKIRKITSAKLVSYNNDDPFSPLYEEAGRPGHLRRYWKLFRASIPEYDFHFVYRHQNIDDFLRAGAREVDLLRSYYLPELHRPIQLDAADRKRFECDVVFVGHFEPYRMECLEALIRAGVHVRLFGSSESWSSKIPDSLRAQIGPVRPALDEDYVKALCGAKMCLCFFSRLNRDTYTRRVFEIPACGRVLVSERTKDMESLYVENEEAVYFSSAAELVAKTANLLRKPAELERIAAAGRVRCLTDGYSVDDRMAWMLRRLDLSLPSPISS